MYSQTKRSPIAFFFQAFNPHIGLPDCFPKAATISNKLPILPRGVVKYPARIIQDAYIP